MATTQKTASPKKSQGFTGVRGAFWIIVVCAIIAFTLFFTWFANGMHFQDGDSANSPLDVWGTIYKGGLSSLQTSRLPSTLTTSLRLSSSATLRRVL